MNCKSCDNGLVGFEEELHELCRGCHLDELVEKKVQLIVAMIDTWELNGQATRHLISKLIEVCGT